VPELDDLHSRGLFSKVPPPAAAETLLRCIPSPSFLAAYLLRMCTATLRIRTSCVWCRVSRRALTGGAWG